MRKQDNTIAKIEAIPERMGLISIVTQLIAVERKVAPTDSVRVIIQQKVREIVRGVLICRFQSIPT